MEPHRRPSGCRVLLPAEVELCNAIGITQDDYFYFLQLSDAYNGKRSKEYELIPDVRNDPTTLAITSLVVGLASSAVSVLLSPKPRAPETRKPLPSIRTADITGQSRFAPQSNFSSVQELASLGTIVPLIFTRRGLRVNGQLLWSQMRSKGLTQQLNAIFMFSAGRLPVKPDFAGFAIGDSLLETYTGEKLNLLFNVNGGRLRRGGSEYPQGKLFPPSGSLDVFSVYWDLTNKYEPVFCQTSIPSTQTQFGAYSPMPNGQRFKVNYELVLIPDNNKNAKEDARVKDDKIEARFPRRCNVLSISNSEIVYRIGDNDEDNRFSPWGVEDVRQSVQSTRVNADAALSVGELYLAGTNLAVCTKINNITPWRLGLIKEVTLKWTEGRGPLDITTSLDTHQADQVLVIQRAAVATVSTSRPCDAIEIGIKSTVFRQINGFSNVNSYPNESTRRAYEKKGGSFTLGSVNKYIKRYSFFRLQRRPAGSSSNWADVIAGEVFAVKGSTPQAQYNSIKVYHSNSYNWEYRLHPYPGNQFRKDFLSRKYVNILSAGRRIKYVAFGRTIVFSGYRAFLRKSDVENKEWILAGEGSLLENDAIADYVVYDQENSSHLDSPEHEISYVNEYILNNKEPTYNKLAIAGIRIASSKEWTNFDQFSAFFKRGIVTKKLLSSGRDSVNIFPEIVYALLTDNSLGAGSLIGSEQVDTARLTEAARFCQTNGFFWDGIISERQNLREFIFENAAYCLLDFTIIGGRFSLFPSVPRLSASAKPDVKALFTDGNMRNLQVSFLSPEERQLFKAVCLWRQDTVNGFPQTRTLEIRLAAGSAADPEEVFDMSGFCTSEEHARKFAKFALKTRKEVDHGIKFETTPQAAMGLNPGDYFRVVSEATHTSRFDNGSVSLDGAISSKGLSNGTYDIYYWKPGMTGVLEGDMLVRNNRTPEGAYFGAVFTLKNSTTTDRVYKVESLSYAEDGLVEVAGSHVPLTSSGTLEVLNWASNQFIEVSY